MTAGREVASPGKVTAPKSSSQLFFFKECSVHESLISQRPSLSGT